jgi:hypothetical protein
MTDNSKSFEYITPNSPLGSVGHLSSHNIITPIKDSEDFFIVNPLSGNADIIFVLIFVLIFIY